MRGYDPYTYQSMLRYFYDGAPLPQDVTTVARADPGALPYMDSVYQFNQWLKARFPEAHTAVATKAPVMLNPPQAVASGLLTPGSANVRRRMSGLSGLADLVDSQPVTDW